MYLISHALALPDNPPQAALLGGNSGLSDGIVMLGETLSLRPSLTEVLIIEHILSALLPPGPSSGPSHTSHPNLAYLPPNLIKPSHASHLFRTFLSSLIVDRAVHRTHH